MYNENKSYSDYMTEIQQKDLLGGLVGEGMFTHQLPPIFQSRDFYNLHKDEKNYIDVNKKIGSKAIVFETMRNIDIPRTMHIPNPFFYFNQCLCIADNWDEIKLHFKEKTGCWTHNISEHHVKKINGTEKLLYDNFYLLKYEKGMERVSRERSKDITHMLKYNSKYCVKADISKCFQSMYTHSIPWALIGKVKAKENQKKNKEFYNELDFHTRNLNGKETGGILIGPHTSNIISEIILTSIDFKLCEEGWKYTRYIDDYTCYVKNEYEMDEFLMSLKNNLRDYNLTLNYEKTQKIKLPYVEDNWVNQLNNFAPIFNKIKAKENNRKNINSSIQEYDLLTFKDIESYLTLVKYLAKENSNFAIVNYAIKIVSSFELTENAKELYIYEILNLSHIYTYLIPLLDEYIFERFDSFFKELKDKKEIDLVSDTVNIIFNDNYILKNDEAIYFSIYYALKYNIEIEKLNFENIKSTENCIVYLLGFLYSKKFSEKNNMTKDYVDLAKKISGIVKEGDLINEDLYSFQENWLFVYEVLDLKDLQGRWVNIKKENISFLKESFI